MEEVSDATPGGLDGARIKLAQERLELGEELFDRVEVWGIGGEEQELGSDRTDGAPDRLPPVRDRQTAPDERLAPRGNVQHPPEGRIETHDQMANDEQRKVGRRFIGSKRLILQAAHVARVRYCEIAREHVA